MPERRTWRTLTPWERAVRLYLIAQAVAVPVGFYLGATGFRLRTSADDVADLRAQVIATGTRVSRLERDHADLLQGLAKLACKADRDSHAYDGYAATVLPCGRLLGNSLGSTYPR